MLLTVGVVAVIGDVGGQMLADALAPSIFGTSQISVDSAEQARDDGEGQLAGARFIGQRYVGFSRQLLDDGSTEDTLTGFSSESARDFWWGAVQAYSEDDRILWARWVDTLDDSVGATIAGSPRIRISAGPAKTPDDAVYKVFVGATKACVAIAAYAVGHELGVFK